MKAGETSLQKLTNGALQFIVPIYQRTYSWTQKQCAQLWKDVMSIAQNPEQKQHFIGSVVYIDMGAPLGRPQQLLLIDGQQRLTTLSLLLCALERYINEHDLHQTLNPNKIRNYFLVNNDESGNDRYKLLLTQQDKETLIRLLDGTEKTLNDPSVRIMENFALFQKWIEEAAQVEKIYEGINRLMLVSVALDNNQDNPQLIFESMNSTGKDLSQADLIRNYILMDLEHDAQTKLYTQYWRSMEQRFGQQGYTDNFDWFVRDFLTAHNAAGRICKIGDVYETFKQHHQSNGQTKEELLKQVHQYARYYTSIHFPNIEVDQELSALWIQIRTLEVSVSYPFLMRVYEDYEKKLIAKDDFILIIQTTISYIVRRVICEIPTNSLNKTFATFYKRVQLEHYVKSVLAEFATKDSYRAFPSDEEVKEKLLTKDVYHLKIKNYLLESLENQGHKEPIRILDRGLTIEHIMPQNSNLSKEWKDMLGDNWEEVQRNYLHTIGNMTLTAYNSELSDKLFEVKKTQPGGFIDSHLRLNNELAQLSIWNEQSIVARTRRLAEKIIDIWKYPPISDTDIALYESAGQTEKIYTSIDHYAKMSPEIEKVYTQIDRIILALDSGIRKEYKKHYIAYKVDTNFADIEPFGEHLKMWLNMPYTEIVDDQVLCKDVTYIGHHGNGNVEIRIEPTADLQYITGLIQQSLKYQQEE